MGDEGEMKSEERNHLRRQIFEGITSCPPAPVPDGWRSWEVWVENHVLPHGPRQRVYGMDGSDVVVVEQVYPGPRTEVAAYRMNETMA